MYAEWPLGSHAPLWVVVGRPHKKQLHQEAMTKQIEGCAEAVRNSRCSLQIVLGAKAGGTCV